MKWLNLFSLLLFIGCKGTPVQEQEYNVEWRYDRTGIYSKETGLLKAWPEGGPELLWHYDGLGEGHSSVAITAEKIYATGLTDSTGYLYVFNHNGELLNKVMYGGEWTVDYPGSRATPTVNAGKIYVMSGTGNLVCLDESNLNIIWEKHILEHFESTKVKWGISESPLIIGEMVIATPGGEEHNVVALDKNTGELIWSSGGVGDLSSFCSPLYIADQETPLIVNHTAEHILGLEAATGNVLWSFEYKNKNSIQANTPIYANSMILCTSLEMGSTLFRLSEGGRKAEIVWSVPELDNMMGALVKVDDYIYGSSSGSRKNNSWYCVDWETGEIKYKEQDIAVGVTIFADGMLYCYTDKGDMMLVNPTPEKFDLVSQFPITLGTDQHWAHPAIYQGVLYVRHGNTLMAYKVK